MKPVVILGSGEHAVVVIDILRAMGGFDIIGCIADDSNPDRLVFGVPIIGPADDIEGLANKGYCAAIGVGGWSDNDERTRLFNRAIKNGVPLITAIHPGASVAPSAKIGTGSVIFPDTTVGVESVIGENVIMHVGARIGHQTYIGDHVLLSGGVTVGAGVTIKESAFVAIGATVVSKVTVGRNSMVSAGSAATSDVPDGARVRGVPAKIRGRRRPY